MQEDLLQSLRAGRFQTRARWEALLRTEPATTPLANPDSLVHLLDWTLDEIFRALARDFAHRRHPLRPGEDPRLACVCGRNPLLAYFAAGEQALRECLVLVQAARPHLEPLERDAALEELNLVLAHISRREIGAFCGVCQHRAAEARGPAAEPVAAGIRDRPAA